MIALLLFGTPNAHAAGQEASVRVCVQYDVDYARADDPGGTYNYAAGDYWTDNSVHQPAMHQFVIVNYDLGTQTVQLDNTGCAWVDMESYDFPDIDFEVEVTNQAEVDGVDVELRSIVNPPLPPGGSGPTPDRWLQDGSVMSVEFNNLSRSDGQTITLTMDAIDGWQFVPIVTYMLDRLDWKLDVPVSRDCCLETGPGGATGTLDADGTCSGANQYPYERLSDPYLETAPLITITALQNSGTCCGSKSHYDTTSSQESGLSAGENQQHRMSISHEVGHVFAGIRMGGWESGQYGTNPTSMDGCNGDFNSAGNPVPDSERGILTKEYMARAKREGWAEYIKLWAWNSPTNASPQAVSFNDLDFDLDGDRDTVFAGNHPYDKGYTVGTGMELAQADSTDPTASWVLGVDENWLWHAHTRAGVCDAYEEPNGMCTPAQNAAVEQFNRATVYDVADFWWTLDYDGFAPERLLALYINTCPRGWLQNDGAATCPSVQDDWPYERLLLSADHFGLQSTVEPYWEDHVAVP